jgi:hypothetical protein
MAWTQHTYNGETLSIGQWAKRFNLAPRLLCTRVYRDGWTLEKALTTKPRNKKVDDRKLNYEDGIETYLFTMRRFYTKKHRLLSYKALISEMKVGVKRIDTVKQKQVLTKHKETQERREVLHKRRGAQKNFEVSDRWNMRLG